MLFAVTDPEGTLREVSESAIRQVIGQSLLDDVLVDAGGLDPDRARAWAVLRAVDYWLWGLAAGFTIDPVRCARIVTELA